ncbi:MAG TPA: zinc ribbon domain-containing protein [Pseudonocardia sp.]|nr:zinc ribbon domain-containing protein [Pseudonocardia sp.]
MPTYRFRCARCGAFDLVRPMARSGEAASCPECGAEARRVFGAPALRALDPAVRGALDASAKSADAPEVVTSVPSAGRRRRPTRITTDPRHATLPRP